MTALHYAIKLNNFDLVRLLLENEAQIYIRDHKLRNAIDMAYINGGREII